MATTQERFVSTTGREVTVILPDQMMAMQTPQGIAYKARPMGRVTIGTRSTLVVGSDKIEALREHPAYGHSFTSVSALVKTAAAAKASTADETAPAEDPADETAPAEDLADETAGDATDEAEDLADEAGELKEIQNVKTINGALSYASRYLDATEADLKDVVAFAKAQGVVFPNLEL